MWETKLAELHKHIVIRTKSSTFADELFKCILMNQYFEFCFEFHRQAFVPENQIDNTTWPFQALQLRHNGRDSISNHQPHDCLLIRLFRRRSKKTPKLRDTGLCAGNSPGTGEFPAQMASYSENVSIWWRHHVLADRCTGDRLVLWSSRQIVKKRHPRRILQSRLCRVCH